MFTVEKYAELLALNKAMMEVRFLGGDIDTALRGSPFLADVHSRVIDELIDYHRQRGEDGKVASWEKWRVFETRTLEIRSVIEYLLPLWGSSDSMDLKRQALTTQMHPFVYNDHDVDRLYEELDRRAN